MKVKYDRQVNVLSIILSDAPVEESGEDERADFGGYRLHCVSY
jgi:hypothetical protein